MMEQNPLKYKELAAKAVQDKQLHMALAKMRDKVGRNAVKLYKELPTGEWSREAAKEVRRKIVDNLDVVLETLVASIRARGGHVYVAETG
ncbi:MAG: iron-sulfur cluster-binding protein, partial [Desulfomicrobium sp.]|nr:iron-sulfur cluster-binding protein [Desulfomicrobium sp.]